MRCDVLIAWLTSATSTSNLRAQRLEMGLCDSAWGVSHYQLGLWKPTAGALRRESLSNSLGHGEWPPLGEEVGSICAAVREKCMIAGLGEASA